MNSNKLPPIYLLALGVDTTIGLGVYLLPGRLAVLLGGASPFVFPLGALALGLIALTLASLARLTARNGGPYTYFSIAFGRGWAFPIGWSDWAGVTIGIGAMGGVLASFLTRAGVSWALAHLFVSIYLAVLAGINLIGVRPGGRAMLLFTALKLFPLLLLIAGPLPHLTLPSRAPSMSAISEAMIVTLFLLQGFELVPVIAGETERPTRAVPPAILLCLAISALIYAAIQWQVAAMGSAVDAARPLSSLARLRWGEWGGRLLDLGAIASVLGLLAGRMLAAPRYLSPLCEDGLFPRALGRSSVSIVVTLLLALPFSWLTGLEDLVGVSTLGVAFQYGLCAIAWMRLAKGWSEHALGGAALFVSLIFLFQAPGRAWGALALGNLVGGGLFLLYRFKQHEIMREQRASQ
jgi:amino acid transporter